ncbi:MAG TPA: hypothetical protein VGK89_12440 [Candidatus Eisenbacteria bacterium]
MRLALAFIGGAAFAVALSWMLLAWARSAIHREHVEKVAANRRTYGEGDTLPKVIPLRGRYANDSADEDGAAESKAA